MFLKTIEENVNFVILDDEAGHFNKLKKYLVKINNYYGLTLKDVKKAVELLKLQEEGKL